MFLRCEGEDIGDRASGDAPAPADLHRRDALLAAELHDRLDGDLEALGCFLGRQVLFVVHAATALRDAFAATSAAATCGQTLLPASMICAVFVSGAAFFVIDGPFPATPTSYGSTRSASGRCQR